MARDTETGAADDGGRVRLIIDTEEPLRRAVRMRAGLTGGTPSTVINALIRTHLAAEIAEAVRQMKAERGRP